MWRRKWLTGRERQCTYSFLVASLLTRKYGRSVVWALCRQNSLIKETRLSRYREAQWTHDGLGLKASNPRAEGDMPVLPSVDNPTTPHCPVSSMLLKPTTVFSKVEPIICGLQLQSLFGKFLWDCVFPTFLSPKFVVPFPESERMLLKFSSGGGAKMADE